MTGNTALSAAMIRRDRTATQRRLLGASATAQPGLVVSCDPRAKAIARMLEDAREEMGYHREGFIRVEHPDDVVPGTRFGRFRVAVPDK